MERKRIKKYNNGGVTLPDGFTAGKGFTGTAAGQGIGMFGGMLGSYITQADQADGHMSTGGALGGGALKGAAMGAALGPIGMLGGAAIGAIGGLMQRDKFNDEQRKKEEAEAEAERARKAAEEQLKLQQMDAALNAHPVKGTGTPRFNYGGGTGGNTGGDTNGTAVTDPFAKYADVFPTFATPALPNDRLTNYSEAEMLQNEQLHNKLVDNQSLDSARETANNVAAYHVDKPLDAISMDLALLGQLPVIGEPFDMANAGLSFGRGVYYDAIGDTAKAKEQAVLGSLSTASAIPFVGNAAGATRLAHGAHKIAHGAHKVERGVIGAKGYKAATHSPSYMYGGPTVDEGNEPPMAFNTKYVGIPSFADPMDRNAMPTMNWYLDGQPVSGTDMVKALPEGTNINDLGNYWYRKMKPRYDAVDGWSNVGNNNDAIRANSMLANMQQSEYAMGGTTIPQYEAEGGEMIQYQLGDMPKVYGKGGITEVSSQEYEIKGPSHKQGGVDMSDDKGARIYSNKLTVDKALMEKLSKL